MHFLTCSHSGCVYICLDLVCVAVALLLMLFVFVSLQPGYTLSKKVSNLQYHLLARPDNLFVVILSLVFSRVHASLLCQCRSRSLGSLSIILLLLLYIIGVLAFASSASRVSVDYNTLEYLLLFSYST